MYKDMFWTYQDIFLGYPLVTFNFFINISYYASYSIPLYPDIQLSYLTNYPIMSRWLTFHIQCYLLLYPIFMIPLLTFLLSICIYSKPNYVTFMIIHVYTHENRKYIFYYPVFCPVISDGLTQISHWAPRFTGFHWIPRQVT
jgi:hypothetical protein